jgi:hypothetical protein
MSKVFKIALVLLCCAKINLSAQTKMAWQSATKKEVLAAYQSMSQWFSALPTCYIKLQYKSFKDHQDEAADESASGYFIRAQQGFHGYALGVHRIQNEQYTWTMDSATKIIVVNNASKALLATNQNMAELEEALVVCKKFSKKILSPSLTQYRLEFDPSASVKYYEFSVLNTGEIKGLSIYYNAKESDDPNDANKTLVYYPKLQIIYQSVSKEIPTWATSGFQSQNYFIKQKQKLVPVGQYKSYQIFDQRNLKQ